MKHIETMHNITKVSTYVIITQQNIEIFIYNIKMQPYEIKNKNRLKLMLCFH